jgi:hypothetical protein
MAQEARVLDNQAGAVVQGFRPMGAGGVYSDALNEVCVGSAACIVEHCACCRVCRLRFFLRHSSKGQLCT